MTGLMQVFWFTGAAVSGVVGVLLFSVLGPDSWRWMLGSAVLLAVVVMIMRQRVPESAAWKRAHEEATAANAAPAATTSRNLRILGFPGIRAALVFSCLFWFLVTVRGAGYNLYTPTFLSEVGLSSPTTSLLLGTVVNVVNALAALAAVRFLDRGARRQVILWCWGISTVLTLGLAAISGGHVVLMFVMITVSALPLQMLAMALFPLSVEPFPTLVRGTAQSLSSASGKAGGFIAALALPVLLAGLGWQTMTLALTAVMAVGLVIGLFLRIPDTRARNLESIEADLTAKD
jgi:putative MFS transporter